MKVVQEAAQPLKAFNVAIVVDNRAGDDDLRSSALDAERVMTGMVPLVRHKRPPQPAHAATQNVVAAPLPNARDGSPGAHFQAAIFALPTPPDPGADPVGYATTALANANAAFELWNERWQQMAKGDQTQTGVENTALTTWIDAAAGAEAQQQIDDSAAAKSRDTDEAKAQHTYAYAAADNQWTFDEDTAAQQQSAADQTADAELTRDTTDATTESNFNTAEYANAATVMATFASALGTPWAQYRSDLAAAEATWAANSAPEFLNYQNTLATDQWTYAYAVAKAATTQADDQADADRGQSKSDADAALTQATDDATAADDYQQADAGAVKTWRLAMVKAETDLFAAGAQAGVDAANSESYTDWEAEWEAADAARGTAIDLARQAYFASEAEADATQSDAMESDQLAAEAHKGDKSHL